MREKLTYQFLFRASVLLLSAIFSIMYEFIIFTSVWVFYCGIIVYIQVFYLKKIETSGRLTNTDGYFGERDSKIEKSNSWGVKLTG